MVWLAGSTPLSRSSPPQRLQRIEGGGWTRGRMRFPFARDVGAREGGAQKGPGWKHRWKARTLCVGVSADRQAAPLPGRSRAKSCRPARPARWRLRHRLDRALQIARAGIRDQHPQFRQPVNPGSGSIAVGRVGSVNEPVSAILPSRHSPKLQAYPPPPRATEFARQAEALRGQVGRFSHPGPRRMNRGGADNSTRISQSAVNGNSRADHFASVLM